MAIETVARDFTDTRVFVVGLNDLPTHCIHPNDYFGVEQSFDGPRYIIVGPAVSDERIERNIAVLSSRYGVTMPQLVTVRDNQLKRRKAQVI